MSPKRSRSQVVHDDLTAVERCLASHLYASAKRLLEGVEPEVQSLRRNRSARDVGCRYDQLVHRQRVESANPCGCWTCGLSADQKRMVAEFTEQKAATLDCIEGSEHENNLTGAYAEVIFGVKFHLLIKLKEGRDGGVDFRFPCQRMPSGTLTVDIKGTVHDQFRLPAVPKLLADGEGNLGNERIFIRTAHRYEESFIRRG